MTVQAPEQRRPQPERLVELEGSTLVIRDLRISHPDTVAMARLELETHGAVALATAVTSAITIGLLATTTAGAQADTTNALAATLRGLAGEIDERARDTLTSIKGLSKDLEQAQRQSREATAAALAELPDRLERALTGEADTLRSSVRSAVDEVHQRALSLLDQRLRTHSESVRSVLSTENPASPIAALRRDVSDSLEAVRRELTAGLTGMQAQLAARSAAAETKARSSTQRGAAWEQVVNDAVAAACEATGDLWAATGGTPAPGTTAKLGDLVIRLQGAYVPGDCRVAVESKNRSRAFSLPELVALAAGAKQTRRAQGALIVVPDAAQLPGPGRWIRLDASSWAVAIGDGAEHLALVLSVLREVVLSTAIASSAGSTVDLGAVQVEVGRAAELLERFDVLLSGVGHARKHMDAVGRTADSLREALQDHLSRAVRLLRT